MLNAHTTKQTATLYLKNKGRTELIKKKKIATLLDGNYQYCTSIQSWQIYKNTESQTNPWKSAIWRQSTTEIGPRL